MKISSVYWEMIPIKKLRHVSDIIAEDYMSWSSGDIILIDTQTGSGKTHFVLNTLLPYIASRGKHILYLSNRSALREQVDLAYNKEYDPFILSETYQKFVHTLTLKKAGYDYLNAEYIVMDEAHYFLDDTQFNGDIHSCLEKIKNGKAHHINIFMTATSTYLLLALNSLSFWEQKVCFPEIPYLQEMNLNKFEGLKEPNIICSFLLQYKELSTPRHKAFRNSIIYFKGEEFYNDPAWRFSQFKAFYQSHYGQYSSYFSSVFSQYNAKIEDAIKQIHFYNGEKDYSYVSPLYYHDDSELVQKIIESSEDEQWLIFTSSINAGHKLHVQCLESGVSDKKQKFFLLEGRRCIDSHH